MVIAACEGLRVTMTSHPGFDLRLSADAMTASRTTTLMGVDGATEVEAGSD